MTGLSAFELFSKSGLPKDQLAMIWEISDQDGDGNLVMEEFVLAMYLINAKRRNIISEIPRPPPPEYIIPVLQVPQVPQVPMGFFPPPPSSQGRYMGNNL